MTDYNKLTAFTPKDSLPVADPASMDAGVGTLQGYAVADGRAVTVTPSDVLFWLADNVETWRSFAFLILATVFLACVYVAFVSLEDR